MLRIGITSTFGRRRIMIGNDYYPIVGGTRNFWFGNGNSNNDNNKSDDSEKSSDKKKKKNSKQQTNDDHKSVEEEGSSNQPKTKTTTSNNLKSFKNNNDDVSNKNSSSASLMPTKLGSGDDSPRYPHLTALPIITRPVFPGIVTSVTLTDPATIEAMGKLSNSNGIGGYIGVFLRKNNSSGVSDNGVIIEKPEIITDPNDLYSVGTFAQIHRFIRSPDSSSDMHVHPDFTNNNNNNDRSNADIIEQHTNHHHGDNDAMSGENNFTASLLLMAHRRINLESIDQIGPPIDVTVSHWDRLRYTAGVDSKADDTIRALSNEILSTIREVAQINGLFREHMSYFPSRIGSNDPYKLADVAATLTTGTPEELQAILEDNDAESRLHKALVLLSKERAVSKLQQEISQKVEEKMTETQRKYFLTEQLKSIKKELGMEKDDKDALISKYKKKIESYGGKGAIPVEVMETIESEMEKLATLEKNSSEFNVTRSYLDWLTSIPWGVVSEENFDIRKARGILDRDHYGLDEVKDTILQFIAVGKLKGTVQGKILCLAGPPGVGKTSIAESVASALGRKFFRFSVGGLSDVSEINGHRRTYVGAMPGKLIQCLKSTGTTNPLLLIDEIDKLGTGYRGDPASALLEVLDPSQNSKFRDHFLDVPVDISKILFMCTANALENIPGPLLDRMEVIRLSGYDVPEKVSIAEQYLVPKALRDSGLYVEKADESEKEEENDSSPLLDFTTAKDVPDSVSIGRSAIENLVRWYCREAGVRNLNKHIEKIARKLALQVVAEGEGTELTEKSSRKEDTWEVTENNLHEYVGKAIFTSDRLYDKDPLPKGIVMGLAWTSMGGSALYIETQAIERVKKVDGKSIGGGNLKVTGQLGKVMEESTQIAYTVARTKLSNVNPSSSYFDDFDIHMHVPEGATPKDGPSAGITMTTAMLSLAMDRPIRNDLAMTGEISLTGKVLPVGGIKEKTMAARRAGIKCIIFPSGNKRDYDEMPEYLKENLDVHFADDYAKVFEVSFN